MITDSNHMTQKTARGRVKPRGVFPAILRVAMVTGLLLPAVAPADENSTQRPLPLPDQRSVTENDHLQRLRQLRAMMQQVFSSNNQRSEQQAADSSNKPSDTSDADTQAPDARGLQQLGDALKSLADKLPPGMIPPSLDSIPKEQLREAVRNPLVQERMRKMLEQFNRDGLLPQENTGKNETGLPLPPLPQNPSATDARGNRDNRDENDERPNSRVPESNSSSQSPQGPPNRTGTDFRQPSEQPGSDSKSDVRPPADPGNPAGQSARKPNAIPPQSMKMLEQFLKGLTQQTNSDGPVNADGPVSLNDQTTPDESQSSGTARQRQQPGDSSQTQSNPGARPPRGPLRRNDRSTNPAESIQPRDSLPPNGTIAESAAQPDLPSERMSASRNQAETPGALKSGTKASAPSTSSAQGAMPDADSMSQILKGLLPGAGSNPGNDGTGFSMNPEQQQRSLQALQEVLQELSAEQNSSDAGDGGLSSPLKSMAEGLAQNRSGFRSEQTLSPSPQNMRTFTEMLDQLKRSDALKGLGQATGAPDSGRPNGSNRVERQESLPREPSASDAPNINSETNRSSAEAPINIARELEQRGFGETLKKLVEKAKEETRQAARRPSDGSSSGTAAEGLSLNESALKMLGGLKEEISELAKDPEIQREVISGMTRPQARNRPAETSSSQSSSSGSTLQGLRSSVRDLFGESVGSANSSQRPAEPSTSAGSAGTADAVEFDFRAVGFMAGLIVLLLAGAIGLKIWGQRMVRVQKTVDLGPPILPSQVATKADIIRAFHQLVLNSTRPIQIWWTHRAAQKVLEATGPEQRAAVETLTETYEKARYLPQEDELTPEQIQSARAALQTVSRA